MVEVAREARMFLLQQGLDAVEFEGESLEPGSVVGAEGLGRELAGKGARG